jgi:hypothetical protein
LACREFLTGFSKRKKQRQERGAQIQASRERKAKLAERKEVVGFACVCVLFLLWVLPLVMSVALFVAS